MYPQTQFSKNFERSLMFYALPDGVHDKQVILIRLFFRVIIPTLSFQKKMVKPIMALHVSDKLLFLVTLKEEKVVN